MNLPTFPARLREPDVAPLLLFLIFAGVAMGMPPHNDTWWHLRAGAEMVANGGILTTERLSHTAFGSPLYHNHEWLTQLVFLGLYSLGGPLLLAAFGACCALLALAGAWTLTTGSAEVRVGWLTLLFLGTVSEWAVRPQVISLAIFVLAVRLVIAEREKWLPALCLVWFNLHAVAITSVIIAGCAVIEALLWSRSRLRLSVLVVIGCLLAAMATPLGWHYWPRVFQVVRLARELQIDEYRSAFEWAQLPFWCGVAAFAFLAARPRVLAAQPRSTRILVILGAVFAVLGAMSVRNIPMFVLAAVPAVSRLLPTRTPHKPPRPAPVAARFFLAGAALLMIGGVAFTWRDRGAHLGWQPVSAEAAAAIRSCSGPLFNGFADGGALTWFVPEQKVFVDSRGVEAYPLDLLLMSRDADLNGQYEAIFERYDIHCAAVAANSVMALRLSKDPQMRKRFSDAQWAVFDR